MQREHRRLAAVVFTDMVGFSSLSQRDEALAMELLDSQSTLVRNSLKRHRGREVKAIGDGFLIEFPSALDAVRFAVEAQEKVRELNQKREPDAKVSLRIGIHVGDVISRGGDLFGDTVNIASRVVKAVDAGGVCFSRDVYDQVRNKVRVGIVKLPSQDLKGLEFETELFRLVSSKTGAPSRTNGTGRIAVLPFTNISPDPNDSYFAHGLTEELTSALSEVKGLRVIARTSADHYKRASKSARQIGRELRVSHLLEGSVRKAGKRVRIDAHLVDTDSEEEVWSQRYEQDLVDVFSIQSSIASSVTSALRIRLLEGERDRMKSKETENVAAYIAYLKGRSLLREGTEKSAHLAGKQFELAIRNDPKYAKAYAAMADTKLLLGDYLFSPVPLAIDEAQSFVRQALELDPDLAEARVSLGTLMLYDYRFRDAEKEFRKALESNPSDASGIFWYSVCLQCFGRREEALQQLLTAETLDPLSSSLSLSAVYRLISFGRFEEARKRISKLEEIDRKSPLVDEAHMVYSFFRKDWPEALKWLRKMRRRDPNDPYLDMDLAYIYGVTGRRDEAKKLVEGLQRVPEDLRVRGQLLAVAYLGLGDLDAVFESLNYALSKKEFFMSWLRGNSIFAQIRKDHRYYELLKAANLPPDP